WQSEGGQKAADATDAPTQGNSVANPRAVTRPQPLPVSQTSSSLLSVLASRVASTRKPNCSHEFFAPSFSTGAWAERGVGVARRSSGQCQTGHDSLRGGWERRRARAHGAWR